MERNYADDLRIDPMALDVEWLDQPNRFMYYAELAASARDRMDKAKESLDIMKAKLDREIRQAPGMFQIDKITESAIMNTIITRPEYQKASTAVSTARYDYDMAQAAVRAFDQRKDALEYLVKLMSQQYFAAPKEPRDLNTEYIKRAGQRVVRESVKKALNPEPDVLTYRTEPAPTRRRKL